MSASAYTIIFVCLVAAFAGSLTMAYGAFSEGKKYEPTRSPTKSAVTIGISYLLGGFLVCVPHLLTYPNSAIKLSVAIATLVLFFAGFTESKLHGTSGWKGAARVLLFGAVAFTAAFFAGKVFAE